MAKNLFADEFSEPINGEKRALIDIHAGNGNLTMDGLSGGEPVLASGRLEYFEDQGSPTRHLEVKDGDLCLSMRGSRDVRPRFRMPWAECNGATNWSIHLNPDLSSDITAQSNGGNLKLDFNNMLITRLFAYTGGGNIDIILPDKSTNLTMDAKSGAGNVSVCLPSGIAAHIRASTGLGKVIMDPRFDQIDKTTYQSPNYEEATKKAELMIASGAGNIIVSVK